VTCAVELTQ